MSENDIRDNQILDLQDITTYLKERISELEKHEETVFTSLAKNITQIIKNKNEIAELKEGIKIEAFEMSNGSLTETNTEDIIKLKERYVRAENQQNRDFRYSKLNREVLRDHIKWHKTPTYQTKVDEKKELDKQLEKLDGVGSARQTEKKETTDPFDPNFDHSQCYFWCGNPYCHSHPSEDSEGEKRSDIVGSGGATPTRNVDCEIPISTRNESDDSKPAEPKYLCLKLKNKLRMGFLTESLWKLITNANKIWKWKDLVETLLLADESSNGTKPKLYNKYQIRKSEPRENLYFCRLCGNEITDVEHEISKLTVEVKREDLQRWKKEFEKIGHPEWEYIEEEYGIE